MYSFANAISTVHNIVVMLNHYYFLYLICPRDYLSWWVDDWFGTHNDICASLKADEIKAGLMKTEPPAVAWSSFWSHRDDPLGKVARQYK